MVAAADLSLRGARVAAADLLRWWLEELGGMVPSRVRHLLWLGGYNLVLETDGKTLSARRVTPRRQETLGSCPLAEEEAGQGLPGLAAVAARAQQVTLRLPASMALVRRVSLPLAAEENLHEVLGFEMERHAPLPASQVYYDERVVGRSSASRTLEVELVVAPRDQVDPVLERVRALGAEADVVTLGVAEGRSGEGGGWPNVLPPERRPSRSTLRRSLNLALAGLLLALIVGVAAQPLLEARGRLRALEAEVKQAQAEAGGTRELEKRLEALLADSDWLDARKRDAVPTLALLREVTRLLPDDTWVTQLDLRGAELQLQGESRDAAALIPVLEASPLLEGARFRSPVTQGRDGDVERFHLSSQVGKGDAS